MLFIKMGYIYYVQVNHYCQIILLETLVFRCTHTMHIHIPVVKNTLAFKILQPFVNVCCNILKMQ